MPLDPEAKFVVIQRNPNSGSGWRQSMVRELVRELKKVGLIPRLFRSREKLDNWVRNSGSSQAIRCLVAAGGDGTVGDLINRHPSIPAAILPVGTENLLARGLGVPPSPAKLARMIADGNTRRLDVCDCNSRRFTLIASAGFDADIVHRVQAARTGNISHLTYIQPILNGLRNYTYPELRVWLDSETKPRLCRQLVVVNFPMYALGLPMAKSAVPDDGLLDLRLFERGSAFQMVRYFCNLAIGRHEQLPDVQCVRARSVRVEADLPVPLQLDGDPAQFTPAQFSVVHHAMEVVVPA